MEVVMEKVKVMAAVDTAVADTDLVSNTKVFLSSKLYYIRFSELLFGVPISSKMYSCL